MYFVFTTKYLQRSLDFTLKKFNTQSMTVLYLKLKHSLSTRYIRLLIKCHYRPTGLKILCFETEAN